MSERELKNYWSHGEGAAKIRWGTDGDFDRCVRLVTEAVTKNGRTLAPPIVKGLCANLHREATGHNPGEH